MGAEPNRAHTLPVQSQWMVPLLCGVVSFAMGLFVATSGGGLSPGVGLFARGGPGGPDSQDTSDACVCPSREEPAAGGSPRDRTAPARAVVLASRGDDTVWTLQQIPDLCLVPYAHVDNATRTHAWEAVPNRGREASIYISFILDHWDNLPDRTVFLHGHYAPGWHSTNIAEIVRHLNWDLHYANLNFNYEYNVWTEFADEPNTALSDYHRDFQKLWSPLWEEATGLPQPPYKMNLHCCAQFMVSRDYIRRHPKAWYQKALAFLHSGEERFNGDVGRAAIMFEFTWEYILVPGFANYTHCGTLDCDICAVVHGCVNGSFAAGVAGNFAYDPAYHSALTRSYPCGPWADW